MNLEQERSALSATDFCRRRRISPSQFYSWRARLHRAARHLTPGPQFVALQVARQAAPAAACARTAIEIRLAGPLSVLVEPGFDPAHLRALLAVLEDRA